METEEEFEPYPDISDFHGNKRELIKRGVERGEITWAELQAVLPPEHISDTELEVLLFTLRSLKIELIGFPR